MTFEQLAVQRVEVMLMGGVNERIADILADLIHYCNEWGVDFTEELQLAEQYVSEELGVDSEE
jgi:NTP pyrophosphatase (non-canonical NTP hydrolase)